MVIPDGVNCLCKWKFDKQALGNLGVFLHSENIRQIILPEELNLIAPSMFEGCAGLRKITIPWGIYYIDKDVFKNCVNLCKVILSYDHEKLIHPSAFEGVTISHRWGILTRGILLHAHYMGRNWIGLDSFDIAKVAA